MKLKVIDLFSGCGGLNEGFKKAGFKTSVSNDIWKPAGDTFKRNNKNSNFIFGDITNSKVRNEIIKLGQNSDVIIGGPPCQAYSLAGNRNVEQALTNMIKSKMVIIFFKLVNF